MILHKTIEISNKGLGVLVGILITLVNSDLQSILTSGFCHV